MVNLMRIVARYPLSLASWNRFSHVLRKQAMAPALNSIMRSHNAQFLPILWRTNFKPDEDESKKRAEEGLDNSFSLADITLKQHIPYVIFPGNDGVLTQDSIEWFGSSQTRF